MLPGPLHTQEKSEISTLLATNPVKNPKEKNTVYNENKGTDYLEIN